MYTIHVWHLHCPRSLSMVHDSTRNSCPNQGGVMAATLGRGLQLYEWSTCSAEELKGFRMGGGTWCLMEMDPGNVLVTPSYPGRQFDLDYQCKAMFGDHATLCPFSTGVSAPRVLHTHIVWCNVKDTY